MTKELKRYCAWKTDKDGNPIEGEEKYYTGVSKRRVLNHIAYENNIPYHHNPILVRLNDGTMWFVSQLTT